MSMLFRCLLYPTWRRLVSTPLKVPVRQQASPSHFANVEKSRTQNQLVFEYKDRILPFFGAIGLLQFVAFDLIAYWSFYLFGTVTAREDRLTSDSTLIDRAATIVPTNRFRYATNGSIVLLSGAIFAVCIIYPARCIRRLYLLKDGASVGIVTYGFWPGARKFIVPLQQVSSQTSLQGVGIFHKLQIKDRWFSHLVNRREGKFYNKSLYETVIALKRF